METLTRKQFDALRYAAAGLTNRQIADHMGIGPESVKSHLAVAYRKLGVGNRIQAINAARRAGYFNDTPSSEGDTGVHT